MLWKCIGYIIPWRFRSWMQISPFFSTPFLSCNDGFWRFLSLGTCYFHTVLKLESHFAIFSARHKMSCRLWETLISYASVSSSERDVTHLITSACWVAPPHGPSFLLDDTFRKSHGGHSLQHSTVTAFPCSGPWRVKHVTLSSLTFKWTLALWLESGDLEITNGTPFLAYILWDAQWRNLN